MKLGLHGYWRSSATWRVRIALALKQVPFEYTPVHIVDDEQSDPDYVAKNPMAQVPTLTIEEDGRTHYLFQSLAILDWLDARFPSPSLYPTDPLIRAHALQLAEIVNSGIQPLQNLRVLRALSAAGIETREWALDAIQRGLDAYEHTMDTRGRFSVGDAITVADLCLVPQLYNARRFEVPLDPYPGLLAVEAACEEHPAFHEAHPDRQPDAPTAHPET
jgi:maleylpyruvate isomerase